MDSELIADLAIVAHKLWCAKMLRDGWRPGPRFDAQAKVHDAIKGFDRLSEVDQRHARTAILADELDARLAAAVTYPRGPDRELSLDDMRSGALVRSAASGATPTGLIESWERDGPRLTLIRVRWSDGSRSEHDPVLRELARVDEASSQ